MYECMYVSMQGNGLCKAGRYISFSTPLGLEAECGGRRKRKRRSEELLGKEQAKVSDFGWAKA